MMALIANLIYNKLMSIKTTFMCCIILTIIYLVMICSLHYFFPNYLIRTFLTEFKSINLQYKPTSISLVVSADPLLSNLTFSPDRMYHHDGIAYDYYSKNDLGQSRASYQWKNWPLSNEITPNSSTDHIEISPFIVSKLPFVDAVYVTTGLHLIQRHASLKKALHRQGIPIESLEWRMKWNYTTCNSNSSHSYVYQRMNLKDKPLNKDQRRVCAITMEHVDVWYEIAERKVQLALILEDDVIFVPFFKEKFTRMIYAAIHSGVLRINGTCVNSKKKPVSNDESIDRSSVIFIGTCPKFYSISFQRPLSNAPPLLSARKTGRCTHAYLLTSCSAQALVDQIQAQKNGFLASDYMQTYLFGLSSTLQPFSVDPPLAYQGNKVIDLDKTETYRKNTYKAYL